MKPDLTPLIWEIACAIVFLMVVGTFIVGWFRTHIDHSSPASEDEDPSEVQIRQLLVQQRMSMQPIVHGMTPQMELDELATYERYILYGVELMPEEE